MSREDKKSKSCSTAVCQCLRRNGFLLLLLVCTLLGYGLGILLRPANLSSTTRHLIGFPGQLVLRSFLMIIVPIIFCSLVLGVSSLRKGGDARMVATTLGFFVALSASSAVMGAAAGHLVHPGQRIQNEMNVKPQSDLSGRKGVILDSMFDLLWNSVPNNIIQATFSKEFTHVVIENSSDTVVYKKSIQRTDGVNFMGLLVFSIVFGCGLASLGEKGDAFHQIIEQLNAVVMKIMNYFLMLLPIGMLSWMMREGLETAAPTEILQLLGWFMATALGCVALHQFVLLPVLYVCIVRRNPISYHINLLPAIFTAFGTASSAATLPVTVRCAEGPNRVRKCVSQFVIPLGMIVHMNGGTFYLTLATIFAAQVEGVELGTAKTIIVCVTSFLLMIAAPGTATSGNPVYFLTVMAAAGIPKPQYLSLLISIEWLMERFRTVMNVVADSYVAAFVQSICSSRLPPEADDIEYVDPVLDGYNHPVPVESSTLCRQCGSENLV